MASLANQTISSSYDGLVKTATDQPVGVSGVQLLEDGEGNSLALSVGRANQGVTVTGTLTATTVTGTLSATSVLANGVIATTQATSDNSTKVATTAYVKSVVTAEDLDIAGTTGTGSVDLDSQVLTIAGTANEIETSASGQTITIGLPSTITANVTGNVSGNLTGTVITAAQANITSVGTLTGLTVSGDVSIADKIIHTGDTNTAIRFPAADTVTVETNGSERVRVDSSGNVGIGTATITGFSNKILHIAGTTGAELHITTNGSGGLQTDGFSIGLRDSDGSVQISQRENSFMALSTNDTEKMRITSAGNVGIGTTNPDYGSFGATERILGITGVAGNRARLSLQNTSTGTTGVAGTIAFFNGSTTLASLDVIADGATNSGRIDFLTNNAGSITQKVSILSSGGITFNGDTAAANALDDYEEGTWTPTLPNGGTLTIVAAEYTKIGRQVTVTLFLQPISPTNNASDFLIGGLPFVAGSGNRSWGGSFGYVGDSDLSNFYPITGFGLSHIFFHKNSTASRVTNANYLTAASGGVDGFILTITYFI